MFLTILGSEPKGLCRLPWGFAAAGAASGVAGAAASSAGGKKGSKQSSASEALSQEQAIAARKAADLAVAQSSLTQGLRSGTVNHLNQFLSTGQAPSFLDLPSTVQPLAALSLPQMASDQQTLLRSLQAQGIRGGQLNQSLANASIQGALQRAGLQQQDVLRQEQRDIARTGIRQQLFGAATDLGTGGVTQTQQGLASAMSGLGGAAGNLNVLGAQRIGQNMAIQNSLGNIAGKGLGYAAGQYLPAYNAGSLGAQKAGGGSAGGIGGALVRNTGSNYGPGF